MTGSEAGKDALEILSTAKIMYEIFQRVNEEDNKLAALRVCATFAFINHKISKSKIPNDFYP